MTPAHLAPACVASTASRTMRVANISAGSLNLPTFVGTDEDGICTPCHFLPIIDDRKCTLAFDDLLQLIRYR